MVLVEFAIVLPVLVVIILGILYFGRYENYANSATQLAESGARWAAVNTNPSTTSGQSLANYIASQGPGQLQSTSGDVKTPIQAWVYTPTAGEVRVCVAATVNFPTPLGSPSATITGVSTMHIEQTNTVWTSSTSGMPSQCPTS